MEYAMCMERSFPTREEKIEMLKEYMDELQKEAKGVSELISEMEKKKN